MNACYLIGGVIVAVEACGFVLWCAMRARGSEWSK